METLLSVPRVEPNRGRKVCGRLRFSYGVGCGTCLDGSGACCWAVSCMKIFRLAASLGAFGAPLAALFSSLALR